MPTTETKCFVKEKEFIHYTVKCDETGDLFQTCLSDTRSQRYLWADLWGNVIGS
jgi:hypothetical protein